MLDKNEYPYFNELMEALDLSDTELIACIGSGARSLHDIASKYPDGMSRQVAIRHIAIFDMCNDLIDRMIEEALNGTD